MADLISVMISSRVKTALTSGTSSGMTDLGDLRSTIKKTVESQRIFGSALFDVWLNEDRPGTGSSRETWVERCLAQVDTSEIVVVLYSGEAGYPGPGAENGICYAEYQRARAKNTGEVHYLDISGLVGFKGTPESRKLNSEFQGAYAGHQNYSPPMGSAQDVVDRVCEVLAATVSEQARHGLRRVASRRRDVEMQWARLGLEERSVAMTRSLAGIDGLEAEDGRGVVQIGGVDVLIISTPATDPLTVPRVRETVGRPHLGDLVLHREGEDSLAGPIHLILVRGSATVAQARTLIGDPDAFVSPTPFGVWAAERTYGAQVALVSGCIDPGSTNQRTRMALSWLKDAIPSDVADLARHRLEIRRAVLGGG